MVLERLHRRRFLRQAAFASGMIPLLAGRGIVNAQVGTDLSVEMVHGRILSMSGTTLAVDTAAGMRPVSLVGARIWKRVGAARAQLQAGDFLYARGVAMRDGLLLVTDLWANIVNVSGIIDTVVSSTTFVMQWAPFGVVSDSAQTTTVTMDGGTVLNDGAAPPRSLRVGAPVQVVGTALDEASILASRVFV